MFKLNHYTGLFKKNEPISLRNILLRKSNTKLQPSHKYSTHNQLLFPVLQVFNVATTCSTGNIKAIREFLPDSWSSWTFSFTQTPTLLKLSKPPSNVFRRGRINVESPSKSTLHRDNRICFRELENAERLLLRTRHSEGKQTTERCRGNDATTAPL